MDFENTSNVLESHDKLDWRCPLCGGEVEMQTVATICLECGVSLDPETHEPYRDEKGKIVFAWQFGGGQFNPPIKEKK